MDHEQVVCIGTGGTLGKRYFVCAGAGAQEAERGVNHSLELIGCNESVCFNLPGAARP